MTYLGMQGPDCCVNSYQGCAWLQLPTPSHTTHPGNRMISFSLKLFGVSPMAVEIHTPCYGLLALPGFPPPVLLIPSILTVASFHSLPCLWSSPRLLLLAGMFSSPILVFSGWPLLSLTPALSLFSPFSSSVSPAPGPLYPCPHCKHVLICLVCLLTLLLRARGLCLSVY